MKISIVMPMKPSRSGHLRVTMDSYQYPREDMELVIVEDLRCEKPGAPKLKDQLLERFYKIQWMGVDGDRSKTSIYASPWVLMTNIAVKKASHEAILGTSPECLQVGTVERAAETFSKDSVTFFDAYDTTIDFIWAAKNKNLCQLHPNDILRLKCVKKPAMLTQGTNRFWWYSVLFPRSKFIECGGIEEHLMAGYGWEDDILGTMLHNAGLTVIQDSSAFVLHGYHFRAGTSWADERAKLANLNLCHKYIDEKIKVANVGRKWGDFKTIVKQEVWE